jgi:hypothetical protein
MTRPRPRLIIRIILGIVVTLIPVFSTVLLLRAYRQSTLYDLIPVWVDDVLYWHQAATFSATGFNGGYYTVSEAAALAGFTHFQAWGPFIPVFYGTIARLAGWFLFSLPVVNLTLLTIALAVFIYVTQLGIEQLLLLGALLATYIPFILYAPSSLVEVFQYTISLLLAAGFAMLIKRQMSSRLFWGFVTFILFASLTRVTWSLLFIPCLWLASRRSSIKDVLLATLQGGVLAAVAVLIYRFTASPYPYAMGAFGGQLGTSPPSALQVLLHNATQNISLIGQGDRLEINLRWQVFFVITVFVVLAMIVGLRWKTRSSEQNARLWEYAFHLFVLGSMVAFVILLYDVKEWRDFRMLAAVFLLSLAVMVALKRRWVVLTTVVWMIILMPYGLKIYDIWSGFHVDTAKSQQFVDWREPLKTVLVYDPAAPTPWCNTVLHSAYYIFGPTSVLLAVNPGIGLSSPLLEGQYSFPPKSKYLMLDDDVYNQYASKLHVEPLLDVPQGKLYLNLDAHCP